MKRWIVQNSLRIFIGSLGILAMPRTVLAASTKPVFTAVPVINDTSPRARDLLTGYPGSWLGANPITFHFQWQVCNSAGASCVDIAGANANTFSVRSKDVGHRLRLQVEATNTLGVTSATSSATAEVQAMRPRNDALPVVSGSAFYQQTLRATIGAWTGTPTVTYAYRWKRCNNLGEDCTSLHGANASTYSVRLEDVGHTLRVAVTATNAGGATAAWSTKTRIVAPVAPFNLGTPTISDVTPRDGTVLVAYRGSWQGTAPITYQYQWLACNALGNACQPVVREQRPSIIMRSSNIGIRLRVEVRATNAAGSLTATSLATAQVRPMRPRNNKRPVVIGVPAFQHTLSATRGSWSGTPTISYGYRWKRCDSLGENCTSIHAATRPTYIVQLEDAGHTLCVAVSATNAGGTTGVRSAVTSEVGPVAAINLIPPTISDTTPHDGDVLTAYVGSWRGTEPIEFHYEWFRCNSLGTGCVPISGANGEHLIVSAALFGHRLRVRISTRNPAGITSAESLATSVVEASAPRNMVLPRVSGEALDGALLRTTEGGWGGTGPQDYTIRWQRCDALGDPCITISGATNASYRVTADDVGYALRAASVASNSGGVSAARSNSTAVVAAIPPLRVERPRLRGIHRVGLALHSTPGVWTGTEPITFQYQWLRCDPSGESCLPISGANESTYTMLSSDNGSRVRSQVTAVNAGGLGRWTSWSSGEVVALGSVVFIDEFASTDAIRDPTARSAPAGEPLSSDWDITSGQALQIMGSAWVGDPSGDPELAAATFRMHTQASFGNAVLSFQFRVFGFFSTSETPTEEWDGVHALVRYVDQTELYAVSLNRRDDTLQIKKKCHGGATNNGTYYELSSKPKLLPVAVGTLREAVVVVRNLDNGSVSIDAMIDGVLIERVIDAGVGCAPILVNGSVGIRSDNVEFEFDNFEVRKLSPVR